MVQIRTFSVLSMLITVATLRVAVRNINDAAGVEGRKNMVRSLGRAAPYSPLLLAALDEEFPFTFCSKADDCARPIGHKGGCEDNDGPVAMRPRVTPRGVPGPVVA